MAFVKLYKNNAYFKRFQTKYRRRREGKTDYYARKRLITQDKNKYNTPKYRLVVRITSTKVIAQVVYSTLNGDKILTSADSTELKQFGLTSGLTNYSASYATGLLVAKRLLKQLKLDTLYPGTTDVNGAEYKV
jgi:large subunit ribosomal protein L5e